MAALLAHSHPVGAAADCLSRYPDGCLDMEPVPDRASAGRGSDAADHGGGAGGFSGTLRDQHPAAVRRNNPDSTAYADHFYAVPAPDYLRAVTRLREGVALPEV